MQAALSLGWQFVAVHFIDVDDNTANKLAVALNQTALTSDWDKDALDAILRTVQTSDQDLADLFTGLAEAEKLIPKDESLPKPELLPPDDALPAVIQCPACGHQFDGRLRIAEDVEPASMAA